MTDRSDLGFLAIEVGERLEAEFGEHCAAHRARTPTEAFSIVWLVTEKRPLTVAMDQSGWWLHTGPGFVYVRDNSIRHGTWSEGIDPLIEAFRQAAKEILEVG